MARPTIAAGFVVRLVELAVSKGAPWPELIARSGIDPLALADQDQRIPFEKFVALMRAAKVLCHSPALGLSLGEACDRADRSVIGLIARCSETLGAAFAQMFRYERMISDFDRCIAGSRFVLSKRDGCTWILDARVHPNDFPELTESGLARIVCASRRLFGTRQIFSTVHVTHAAPAYRSAYDRLFHLPVVFGSDRNGLQLADTSWMALETPQRARFVTGVLSERANALLECLERVDTTRGHVECLLIPFLHMADARIERIAARLSMSKSTLIRKLAAEGTSFQHVLDELRRRMAFDYLEGQQVSLNQTAFLVGFSEPAEFAKALKRWTAASSGTRRSARSGTGLTRERAAARRARG